MTYKKPQVSFITINYNSSAYTLKLLESIKEHTSLAYEIIIVDNNSHNEDYDHLQQESKKYKNLKLIRNKTNCGFACANMIAFKESKGEYLFFINNDTQLLNDTAAILKEYLDKNPQVGLATAKIFDDKQKFHSSYKLFPSVTKELFGNSVARLFNKFPSNKTELQTETKVSVVSGSCMFFRRSVFEKIEGFDTHFFLYCEEEDISKRVWESGYEVYFIPQAHIYHKGGGSSDTKSYELLREYYISYIYLIKKHFNPFAYALLLLLMYTKILRRSLKNPQYKRLINDINPDKSLKYTHE